MYKFYLVPGTHASVQFLDEDTTAIVPIGGVKEQEHGSSCIVTWSDKKLYTIDCNFLSIFYLLVSFNHEVK